MRRTTLTELLLDGLRLRLETPADPRDILVSHDNTVIQDMQAMIRAAVQQEVGILRDFLGPHAAAVGLRLTPEAPAAPTQEKVYDDNNTVIQEEAGLRLTREASAALASEVSYDDNNTGIQDKDVAGQEDGMDTAPAVARPRRGVPKLTPRQIRALRDKRQRGVSVAALQEEYGISRASVFRYLRSPKR